MTSHKQGFFDNLSYDIPASIVVFLVAVPLCLGIALASGAPLFSGIIAGIVGGTIISLFSKSQLGVSGPAAGLAVIVLNSIEKLGGFEPFLVAVVVAGIIQIILGIFKAGIIGYYLPSSVIKGMLSGIGLIIILKQIPHAFGYDADPEGDMEFIQPDGHNTFSELFYMLDGITPGALVISIICLSILILWERPFMKSISLTRIIPGPLVAVLTGIGLNVSFVNNDFLSLKGEHVVSLPVSGSFSEFLGQFTLPNFSHLANQDIFVVAVTIAIVASLETLLSVEATDKLDPQRRITPTNRELIAQGIGNTISGFIGGLPVTQVIVRSSANIQSGGKSRASAFFHGVLLLITVIMIPNFLNLIPLASLAAVLLVVGYKLVKPAIFKEVYRTGRSAFVSFVITILGIVFTDLLIGIMMGLVVAVMYILWNNFRTPYHYNPDDLRNGDPIRIELSEDVSFLNKAGIIKTFGLLPEDSHVIIDATRTKTIHWDVLEVINDFSLNAPTHGIKLELIGFDEMNSGMSIRAFHDHLTQQSS